MIADCHNIALMDFHSVDGGISHRIGNLGCLHPLHLGCHIFQILLRRQIGDEIHQSRDALRHGFRRNNDNLLILRQITSLIGRHDNIFIVRENENVIGIDLFNGV